MPHLHLHTNYSVIDGRGLIKDYIKAAQADGQDSIAVTDHGTLGGIIEAYVACKKTLDTDKPVRLIAGMEMYVDAVELREKPYPGHMTVLVRNEAGYRALIAANNLAHRQFYYRPRVTYQQIIENGWAKDWIILSGCMSSPIFDYPQAEALNMVKQLSDNCAAFYLEIMWHSSQDAEFLAKMDLYHNRVKDLHLATGLPIVLTNDCHFSGRYQEDIHIELMKRNTGKSELEFDGEGFYFKKKKDMQGIADDLGIPDAWHNSERIAAMCDLHIPEADKINWYVPDITGGRPEETLRDLCEAKLCEVTENIPNRREYLDRYDHEMAVLTTSSAILNSYLVTHDVVKWCASRNYPVAARGSMAGSLVSWLLGITLEDPVKYDLSFSRAVNPARPTIPDFDLDVSSTHRQEILEYLKQRYEGNIPIAAYSHLNPKGTLRKILRMEGLLSPKEINEATKPLPDGWADGDIEYDERIHKYIGKVPWTETVPERLINFMGIFQGVYASMSVHPSGVLISGPERQLEHEVPLQWVASSKTMAAAFDMYTLKKVGLFKLDVLGLKTLDQLAYMEKISGAKVPDDNYDDPKVLAAFSSDLLAEIFQMDGYACRNVLQKIRGCDNFEDIVAANTLARPGASDFTQYYRSGYEGLLNEYPTLKEILGPTNGLILYQEQVMEISRILADFDDAEQDDVKESIKYFQRKNWEQNIEPTFRERCAAKGIDATHILEAISKMASYTYNKAHALTYAAIAYKMMWYKWYHPAVYYAAVFDASGDKPKLVLESHAFGVRWRAADVNYSQPDTIVQGNEILLGLSAIKGVGPAACEAILSTRPFSSVEDMIQRVNKRRCNSRVIESLQRGFACGSLGVRGALAAFEEAFGFNYRYLNPDKSVELTEWTMADSRQRLGGFIVSLRPFEINKPGNNQGKEMANATIVNINGSRKAILFPDVWKKAKGLIHTGMAIKFYGQQQTSGDFFVEQGDSVE